MSDQFTPLSRRRLFCALGSGVAVGILSLPGPLLAAAKAKGGGNEAGFLGSNQITATIMRHYKAMGLLQIDMGVLVTNVAQRPRAQALGPVLRDAWRSTAQEFSNSYFTPGKVPDAMIIGQRMQVATDRVLGPGVGRVLIMSVVAH